MSVTETIAAGRAFARPGDPVIDADREPVATMLLPAPILNARAAIERYQARAGA
jgi:hypothetical protein